MEWEETAGLVLLAGAELACSLIESGEKELGRSLAELARSATRMTQEAGETTYQDRTLMTLARTRWSMYLEQLTRSAREQRGETTGRQREKLDRLATAGLSGTSRLWGVDWRMDTLADQLETEAGMVQATLCTRPETTSGEQALLSLAREQWGEFVENLKLRTDPAAWDSLLPCRVCLLPNGEPGEECRFCQAGKRRLTPLSGRGPTQ